MAGSGQLRTVLLAAAAGGVTIYGILRLLIQPARGVRRRLQFVPWKLVDRAAKGGNPGILVVDSKHPHLPCLTHHKTKEEQMPPKNLRGDTSRCDRFSLGRGSAGRTLGPAESHHLTRGLAVKP